MQHSEGLLHEPVLKPQAYSLLVYETGGPKVSVLSLVAQTTQDTDYPATVPDRDVTYKQ